LWVTFHNQNEAFVILHTQFSNIRIYTITERRRIKDVKIYLYVKKNTDATG